jgi:DNA helicase-2/ATP-dependent DNA helicase PcrA
MFLSELPEGPVRRHWSAAGTSSGRRKSTVGRSGPVRSRFATEPEAGDWNWRRGGGRPSGSAAGTSGVRYDFSDSQEELRIETGSRVVHPEFGEGEIVSVSGRGSSVKAEIDFGAAGVRKVMVVHAGLRPA